MAHATPPTPVPNEDGKYHLEADLDCPLCGEVLHGGECR